MARLSRIIVAASLAALIAWTARAASPAVRAQILDVNHEIESAADGDAPASLMPSRLPKFMDDMLVPARETFTIDWTALPPGLPAGVLVTFEYRQTEAEQVKFLYIKYPFSVRGDRRAAFEVSGDALDVGGRVTAWRARVVLRGRLLAERSSENWR